MSSYYIIWMPVLLFSVALVLSSALVARATTAQRDSEPEQVDENQLDSQ